MRKTTLLISSRLLQDYEILHFGKKGSLKDYLHYLLSDPDLYKKIAALKPYKYTKHYQPQGLDLEAVSFYPDPDDWIHLSMLSHGTGFSRSYIFSYLAKFDVGLLALPPQFLYNNPPRTVTTPPSAQRVRLEKVFCSIHMDLNPLKTRKKIRWKQKTGPH